MLSQQEIPHQLEKEDLNSDMIGFEIEHQNYFQANIKMFLLIRILEQ